MMATTPANHAFFILQTQQKSSVELNTEFVESNLVVLLCFVWLIALDSGIFFCLV